MGAPRPRRGHILKHNQGSSTPRTMFFFDTETAQRLNDIAGETEHWLRLGWVCHWERRSDRDRDRIAWYEFHTQAELWDWILSRCRPRERAVVIAHNIAFDLLVSGAVPRLEAAGFTMDGLYDRNKTFLGRFTRDADETFTRRDGSVGHRIQTLELIDNFNFCPVPLSALGEIVGLPKGKIEDFAKVNDDELSTYCRRDVEILLAWWQQYNAEIIAQDLGNWSHTIAGQALAAFRHRFMREQIYIHDSAKTLALERNCYYGGRVECFRVGVVDGPIYHLDVNSMYPAIMASEPLPRRLLYTRSIMSVDELTAELEHGIALCAKVRIVTEEPRYPLRGTGGIIYPVGSFTTYLSTPELAAASARGELAEVFFVAGYEAAVIFREYVLYFYERRLEARACGDPVRAHVAKLMMNSLQGKFGQKSPRWEQIDTEPGDVMIEDVYSAVSGAHYMTRRVGSKVEICRSYGESYNSFPAIPGHITSYARCRLWDLREEAGAENVHYWDTDSLFVNDRGLERLEAHMDGSGLGALSIRDMAESVEIRAPKDYTFGSTVRRKGVRKTAIEIAPSTYRQEQWPGFSSHARAGVTDHFVTVTRDKHLSGTYHKGIVGDDGRVSPFRLGGQE